MSPHQNSNDILLSITRFFIVPYQSYSINITDVSLKLVMPLCIIGFRETINGGRFAPILIGGDADVYNTFRTFSFWNVRYCSDRLAEQQALIFLHKEITARATNLAVIF